MNGYFIFNLIMLLFCTFNFYSINTNSYAPAWAKLLLGFFVILVGAFTAMSYGDGPLSGST